MFLTILINFVCHVLYIYIFPVYVYYLRTRAIYLSASAVVIHYEEALYQVYAPYLTLLCSVIKNNNNNNNNNNNSIKHSLILIISVRLNPVIPEACWIKTMLSFSIYHTLPCPPYPNYLTFRRAAFS